jgi:hypothetical protein
MPVHFFLPFFAFFLAAFGLVDFLNGNMYGMVVPPY